MNVLLTGATGFVGSCLLQKLQRLPQFNFRVAIRARHSLHPDGFVIGSIHRETDWSKALQDVDTVIHLAAYAHVTEPSQLDIAVLNEINVLGTQNLIQQAISAGVKHFILISSIGAVASLSSHPLTEDSACYPDTLYGESKLLAEQKLIALSENTALTYTILRPPLVYGAGNPGNMRRLLKLVGSGVPLLLGTVKNQRSLVYVGNLVDAIATCITHPHAKNQTFLVSDGEDLSTPDLIRQISRAMGKSPKLIPFPLSTLRAAAKIMGKQDTLDRLTGSLVIDSSKIRKTLDWQPPFTLEQGLQDTVTWYLQQSA